jgi:hypothetical protein
MSQKEISDLAHQIEERFTKIEGKVSQKEDLKLYANMTMKEIYALA